MKRIAICLTILLIGIFISTTAFAKPTYVGGNSIFEMGSNIETMNMAFGAGNWEHLTFAEAMTSGLLSADNDFIYIDGSGESFPEFSRFMKTNKTALEDWVKRGGSLFMNFDEPCKYKMLFLKELEIGFDVILHFSYIQTGHAIDPTHTIFKGPNNDVGTNWNRMVFASYYVTGTNLTGLISSDTDKIVLGEKDYGLGHLMIGGITPHSAFSLKSYPDILLANILSYGADCAADPEHHK